MKDELVKGIIDEQFEDAFKKAEKVTDKLFLAANRGREDLVRELLDLDKQFDINERTYRGETLLHLSAREENPDLVKLLLEKGADVNAQSNNKKTSLQLAVIAGNAETVGVLVDAGADMKVRSGFDRTPLHIAAQHGHLEIVKYFVSGQADINEKDAKGFTPLILSVRDNQIAVVEYLIKGPVKCEVDQFDQNGWTALMHATDRHHIGIVKVLESFGAKKDIQNDLQKELVEKHADRKKREAESKKEQKKTSMNKMPTNIPTSVHVVFAVITFFLFQAGRPEFAWGVIVFGAIFFGVFYRDN